MTKNKMFRTGIGLVITGLLLQLITVSTGKELNITYSNITFFSNVLIGTILSSMGILIIIFEFIRVIKKQAGNKK